MYLVAKRSSHERSAHLTRIVREMKLKGRRGRMTRTDEKCVMVRNADLFPGLMERSTKQ